MRRTRITIHSAPTRPYRAKKTSCKEVATRARSSHAAPSIATQPMTITSSFTALNGLAATLKRRRVDGILCGLLNALTECLRMSKLTEKQKRHLRSLGHRLKPVVIIGAHGYTEAVRAELDTSLQRHELMKVRVSVGERETRDLIISQLCADTGAALVQRIGHIALIYRANRDKPRITLP